MSSDSNNNDKGYGVGPYGYSPYGFADITKPNLVSVESLNGETIRVVFSEPVSLTGDFLSFENWKIESTFGVVPKIISTKASIDQTFIDLYHTGTTLGCLYTLTCDYCADLSNNLIDVRTGAFLAKGNELSVVVISEEDKLSLKTNYRLGDGLNDPNNYLLTTDYPVLPKVLGAAQSETSNSLVELFTQGVTASDYRLTVGPAQAITAQKPNFLSHTFTDGSGRLDATSTYRIALDLSGIHDGATCEVSDSVTLIRVIFEDVAGKRIRVVSDPDLDFSITFDWDSHHKIEMLRNQKTGHFALVVDETPIFCVGINDIKEASSGSSYIKISGSSFLTADLSATASNTLFLQDGNFVHEVYSDFLGVAGVSKNRVQVARGPLTKGWGDATPAGINDVSVRVNGVSVPVIDVNPYLGLIYLETPVPKMPVGEIAVEVDYSWFENPQMSFQSLNHPGLVLNKWDQRRNPEVQSPQLATETTNGGSVEGERYPISLTLMRPPRVKPKWISHRHIGFDKSYTASLNSPNALVLNANPVGSYKRKRYEQFAQSGQFEGSLNSNWVGRGNLTLQQNEDGYSTLTTVGAAGVYRSVELNPVGAQVTLVGRVECSEPSYLNERLQLGPAIAFHDSKDLRLLAAVVIDNVSHIALLTGNEIDNPDSWTPAYSANVDLLSQERMLVREEDLPELFHEGLKVVIADGDQSGIYTVLAIDKLSTGDYWLQCSPDFPADITKWGGGNAEVYFETPWTETPFNLHLVGRADDSSIGVSFTGATSFQCLADIGSVDAHVLYRMGSVPLDLTADGRGEILFGNLVSEGVSRWDFVRYITVPDNFILSSIGHLEALTLSEVPTDRSLWRKTSSHGRVSSSLGLDSVVLRSEGGRDQKLGFEKLDPLIPKMGGVEISAAFKVDSLTSWGDAGIRLAGPNHDVLLSTIPYIDDEIFTASSVSLLGSHSFDEQGWQADGFVYVFEGLRLRLSKESVHPCAITNELPHEGISQSRQMDARIAFHHSTFNDLNDAGFLIGMDANYRTVTLLFADNKLVLTSDGLHYLGEVAFDWLDGQEHAYRIKTGSLTETLSDVELWVDGVKMLSVPLADFDESESNVRTYLLGFGTPEYGMDIHSLQFREAPPNEVRKTLGIWKGGDKASLENWQLPRDADSNIIEMDWSDDDPLSVMLVVDPLWGASLLRPDLPTPDVPAVGRTSRHDPTGAWVTVEWEHLPIHRASISNLHFGMQNSVSQAETEWDRFRYRVYVQENEEKTPPRTATLNRWNVLSSGEYTGDITVETVKVKVRHDEILVSESNITAKRVFHVAVNGQLLVNGSWVFDPKNQKIKLDESFPRSSVAEITFSPGRPITKSYLLNQPLKDGITNLNEGTPPYLLTQLGKLQRSLKESPPRENEQIDLVDENPDFEADDPTTLVEFSHESAYSSVEFFQIDNGQEKGVISTPDDGIAPAKGLAHLDLQGRLLVEVLAPPPAYPFEQGGGAPGAFFTAGGGFSPAGTIGGGEVQGSVTWPTQPSRPDAKPSLAQNRTFWEVRDLYTDSVPQSTSSISYEMEIGAEYSRTGPWGGAETLDPISLLNGGEFFSGMMLSGGTPLPEPTRIRRRFDENDNIWTE